MKKLLVVLFYALSAILLPLSAIEYELPILTVNQTTNSGSFDRIHLEYRNTSSSEPLRVSISENTPGGSGNTIRSSVWMATVTAAMQRNNLMSGVRIVIDFSDFVDGPSAGGVICLGILSAMDNRDFPQDFAMTGTIMPDGTVGLVGGVALKMRAAAKSGIKRVCIPAFLRFERQDDGSMVDLFQEAEKLGMKLHPVEHISEAYAFLHNLPQPAQSVINEREACKLSPALEKEVIRQYQYYLGELSKKYKALSSDELNELERSPMGKYLIPNDALSLFNTGKLLTARKRVFFSYIVWRGKESKDEYLQGLVDNNHPLVDKINSNSRYKCLEGLNDYDKIFDKLLAESQQQFNPLEVQFYPDNAKVGTLAAQLENPLAAHSLFGVIFTHNYHHLFSDQDLKKLTDPQRVSDENFSKIVTLTLEAVDKKMVMLKSLDAFFMLESEPRIQLALQLPARKGNSHTVETSRLFYNSWLATDNALETNVIVSKQSAEKMTRDQIVDLMAKKDPAHASYIYCVPISQYMHRNITSLGSRLQNKDYHTLVSTFASIEMLSRACTLMIKHGPELGMYKDGNGREQYNNSAFLHYLLRTARAHALRNIAECQKLNIPCISAIELFEQAEITRENPDSDKLHDVLEIYWKAGFQAKALVLSFQQTK